MAERTLLRLAGGFLVGGLLLTLLASHEHPAGDDDNYPVIFAKYANSNDWVAVHLVQFAGVLLLLGGLLVLYRVLHVRGELPVLAGISPCVDCLLKGDTIDGLQGRRRRLGGPASHRWCRP